MPIASPAAFEQIGTRFRRAVARDAENNDAPVITFKKGVRKAAVMEPLLRRAAQAGRSRGGDRLDAAVPAGLGGAQA